MAVLLWKSTLSPKIFHLRGKKISIERGKKGLRIEGYFPCARRNGTKVSEMTFNPLNVPRIPVLSFSCVWNVFSINISHDVVKM